MRAARKKAQRRTREDKQKINFWHWEELKLLIHYWLDPWITHSPRLFAGSFFSSFQQSLVEQITYIIPHGERSAKAFSALFLTPQRPQQHWLIFRVKQHRRKCPPAKAHHIVFRQWTFREICRCCRLSWLFVMRSVRAGSEGKIFLLPAVQISEVSPVLSISDSL